MFSQNLKDIRKDKQMSQFDLSEATKISQAYISQLEAGLKQPTLGVLQKLSKALNVSIAKLIGEENGKKPKAS